MFRYCMFIFVLCCNKLFAQTPACNPAVMISVNQNPICSNASASFYASVTNKGINEVYTWKINGLNTANGNNCTIANLHDGDSIQCEYRCKTSCGADTTLVSNVIVMEVVNDITPIITVANNDSLICEGEWAVFTATAFYGNASPSYQWMVNGNPVGTNSPVFTTNAITNGSRIECVLTISTPCSGPKSTSSRMNIYVYPMVHPAIVITPSKTFICRGEEVSFTATANGGAYPSFSWEINGKPIGNLSSSLVTSNLKDGDTVSCTVTIDQDSRCHTDSISAPSNKIVMHVRDFLDPGLTINAPVLDICSGTPLTFTASPQNAGDYQFFQWQVNGTGVGDNSGNFTYDKFNDGDKVSCQLSTNIPGCPFTVNVSSNNKMVKVRKLPVISFSPPEISVMQGESAQLHASATGNIQLVTWAPPGVVLPTQVLTASTIPLNHDTICSLMVVDSNGCTAIKEIRIRVLRRLHMPSVFTPNNDGQNDRFRIPPGASIQLHRFSVYDRWGNLIFTSADITRGWDGTYQGQKLPTGTYVYLIKGIIEGREVVVSGTVTLIR